MINREPIPVRPRSGGRRIVIILGIVAFIVLITARWLSTLWTDYLWYDSFGATRVWSTLVFTRVWLVIGASLVAFIAFLVNLFIADRLSPRLGVSTGSPDEELLERFQMWVEPRAGRVRLAMAAFFGVLIGLGAAAWWEDWLLFRFGGDFGISDPIFNNDVGLYVFGLPLYRDLFGWAFQLLLVLTLVVAAVHYLNGGISIQGPRRTSPGVKAHISVLLALIALLKAVGYVLDRWELLYSPRGQVFGASYTDVNAQLPALNLLIIISIVAAIILIVNLWFRGWTLPLVAVGLWLVTSLIVGGVYPALIQRFSVQPDEVNKESAYVAHNIEFTRYAFDLTEVEKRPFAASPGLTRNDLEANAGTVNNIRLWDPGVLNATYRQLQEIRTFYGIEDVDVDRYLIDGELTQVMVASRNLDEQSISGQGWVNERLVFTHGFGAVLSPANNVTNEGEPDFLVRDIPPRDLTADTSLTIDQPRIYFSDSASTDFLIVGSQEEEVDFPIGTASVETNSYDGEGGVPVGGFFQRLAWALRFGDLDTLISSQVDGDSRVLLERNIQSRIARLVPFLYADADPYPVIVGGRIKWVQDLYTITDRFPYSNFADTARLNRGPGLPNRFNYIRNSVKAVVDAYDGTVDLYVIDPSDPLIEANRRIFPGVFSDASEIPAEILQHLRYPEDLFRVQTDMYRLYHVTDPRVFFNVSDPWQIARDPSNSPRPELRAVFTDTSGQRYNPMLPYYLLMEVPGDAGNELAFVLLQPFTPADRPNMVAFMVAKSGPNLETYGDLIEFSLPADIQVDGPGQVGDFVNQDPVIAAEFTLLGQQGSEVIQGNMLVVPIEQSLLYVQPIYIRSEGQGSETGIPQFQRVIASYNRQIEIGDSLDEVFTAIFGADDGEGDGDGGEPQPPTGEIDEQIVTLLERAERAFTDAEAALQAGDLVTWATKIEEAQALVVQANDLIAQAVGTGA